ncbi:outer membrane protein assembly factor BamB family protein [Halocalculus aciditolerans]|uniref:Pyrrolo-quinoline quinone repeat domain-containing protein n=1 Tax=Halocalculus aciditolerans TaxID=1383812 RepID=A0A830FGT9_9EURY|nr:PQQ-binding-like beta-propeller repeat protein [Halocalculus aciditolerans]GGL54472.1 hypothetical protein GCM10009039_10770 [Halocalculus aciditolerans]
MTDTAATRRGALALFGGLALSGCSSTGVPSTRTRTTAPNVRECDTTVAATDWPSFQRDAANTGRTSVSVPDSGPTATETVADSGVETAPVAVGGTLVGGTSTGVKAVPIGSHGANWTVETDSVVHAAPAFGCGCVVAATTRATHVLDAEDGTERSQFDAGSGDAPPIVRDDVLYVADGPTAYSLRDGTRRWRSDAIEGVVSGVAVAGNRVFVTTASNANGDVVALDVADGGERWRYTDIGAVQTVPAVADTVVYVTEATGTLHAIDAETGERRWTRLVDGSFPPAPTVGSERVYVSGGNATGTHAFTTDGERAWTRDLGKSWTPSVRAADALLVPTANEGVYALDPVSGDTIWRDGREGAESGVAVTDAGVSITNSAGAVVRLAF